MTNENTGEKAILTNKGISKMLSDKAISKSVDNGFSREEHLRAVGVVDELFKRAKRAFSKRDEKDKNLSIYRYNAPFKNANALMTLKEYKQNGKRIYSLELENLEAAKFNPSGKDLAEQLSKSKDVDTTTFHTPIDNPDESIAQKSDNIYHSNPHLGAGLVGGVLNGVEQDENGNLSFDPVKFAMGFLGGAAGSKAVKESIKWRANKVKKAYPNIAKNNPTLMEQIAKRDLLTYAKNETQNALTRLLNKNKLFDSTKGLFAGEKALLNEAYAPHKARLEKAKELEGSGADEIEIWEKTGWYKDKDHKWKFEISQRGGELDLAKIKDKDSEAKLGEILKDDELFKAYPQLRDMSVKHVDLSGNYGFYYVPYNDIKLVRPHIQLDIDEIKTSPYKVKEVLYHEIQHAIQHKEQFAYGLSYMAETYERYLKQHGEVEARNIQERMKNSTKIHPHKTMDTDIEDTIAESTLSTEYSEAFSRKLEKSFLDESGRIAYKALIHKAEVLPQSLNLKGFKQMIFNNDKTKQLNAENALIKTPVGEVKVNVLRAFNHYMKNGKNGNHKENRQALNATFMPTLLEPKFVTRDEEGTMYYYKPFISKDKEYHITSIAVKKNGNLDYATSYNATENRLRQMIKHNELVYEKD
nr:LPD23 domain-containing protein [Campylobacter upsaliensis]